MPRQRSTRPVNDAEQAAGSAGVSPEELVDRGELAPDFLEELHATE